MQFYEVEKLSANRSVLPNGSILIRNTPIARTGTQLYGGNETPIKGSSANDTVYIEREEDEVFRPETVASANGVSLVNDHPDEDVDPDNWHEHTLGIIFNPRRGEGTQDDLLVADVLVTTREGIKLINSGKVELSCGYDAKYEKLGPNRGRQHDIVINHAALVDSGRCGSRCSIGDRSMAKKNMWDNLMQAFGVKDAAALEAKLKNTTDEGTEGEEGDEHQHIHVHLPEAGATEDGVPKFFKDFQTQYAKDLKGVQDSIAKVADSIAKKIGDEENEDETEEEKAARMAAEKESKKAEDEEMEEEVGEDKAKDAKKARDSAFLEDSFQETAALAEILVPGISLPTFDSKAPPKKMLAVVCGLRRKALDAAYKNADTKEIIDEVLGGRTYDSKMPCSKVRTVFRSAAAVKRRLNNAGGNRDNSTVSFGHGQPAGTIKSIAEMNAAMKKHYT